MGFTDESVMVRQLYRIRASRINGRLRGMAANDGRHATQRQSISDLKCLSAPCRFLPMHRECARVLARRPHGNLPRASTRGKVLQASPKGNDEAVAVWAKASLEKHFNRSLYRSEGSLPLCLAGVSPARRAAKIGDRHLFRKRQRREKGASPHFRSIGRSMFNVRVCR